MKRAKDIFWEFVSLENLRRAFYNAKRGKHKRGKYPELKAFEKKLEGNLKKLQAELIRGTWRPSGIYRRFTTWDTGKERVVDWNPSFIDNLVQHAIQQTAGQVLLRAGIRDTYSGIPGRGVHDGVKRVSRFIRSYELDLMPIYILKMDVRKFYASIDLERLKEKIRRRIKDKRMLQVIELIIDGHPEGLPIGNYLSQHLANFFLADNDQNIKAKGVKHYARYCDDMVALSSNKNELKSLMFSTIEYVAGDGLEIKRNAQVYPIERDGGLDFLGYNFYRHSIRLRKRNERNFRSAVDDFKKNPCMKTFRPLASYNGELKWTSHGGRLWNKLLHKPLKQIHQEVKNVQTDPRKSQNRFSRRNAIGRHARNSARRLERAVPGVCPYGNDH